MHKHLYEVGAPGCSVLAFFWFRVLQVYPKNPVDIMISMIREISYWYNSLRMLVGLMISPATQLQMELNLATSEYLRHVNCTLYL